jgi:hypothetical protein
MAIVEYSCGREFCKCMQSGWPWLCACPAPDEKRRCPKCNAALRVAEKHQTVLEAALASEQEPEEAKPLPVDPRQRSLFP